MVHLAHFSLKADIDPIEMEETGMVRDVGVLVGKIKHPADFYCAWLPQYSFCPILFGRPFLHTIGARIDLGKERVHIKCVGEELLFNFSKFTDKLSDRKFHGKDQVETLASIAVASSDVVERYLLNQEKPFTHKEKEVLQQELAQRPPLLQLRISPDNLGKLPPPKEDPSYELKLYLMI
jgi:hypothetical protein